MLGKGPLVDSRGSAWEPILMLPQPACPVSSGLCALLTSNQVWVPAVVVVDDGATVVVGAGGRVVVVEEELEPGLEELVDEPAVVVDVEEPGGVVVGPSACVVDEVDASLPDVDVLETPVDGVGDRSPAAVGSVVGRPPLEDGVLVGFSAWTLRWLSACRSRSFPPSSMEMATLANTKDTRTRQTTRTMPRPERALSVDWWRDIGQNPLSRLMPPSQTRHRY